MSDVPLQQLSPVVLGSLSSPNYLHQTAVLTGLSPSPVSYESSTLSPSTASCFTPSDEELDVFHSETTPSGTMTEDELPCIDALLEELDGLDKPISEALFMSNSSDTRSDWGSAANSSHEFDFTDFNFSDDGFLPVL